MREKGGREGGHSYASQDNSPSVAERGFSSSRLDYKDLEILSLTKSRPITLLSVAQKADMSFIECLKRAERLQRMGLIKKLDDSLCPDGLYSYITNGHHTRNGPKGTITMNRGNILGNFKHLKRYFQDRSEDDIDDKDVFILASTLEDPLTMTEISRSTGLRLAECIGKIRRLVEAGFLERCSPESRRGQNRGGLFVYQLSEDIATDLGALRAEVH